MPTVEDGLVYGNRFRIDEVIERSASTMTWRGFDLQESAPVVVKVASGFAQETGIEVVTSTSGGEVKGLAGTFLFRLVQESLTNVRKHAEADRVTVHLEVSDTEVVGRVSDDGRGFEPDQVAQRGTRHFGLRGMKERAELLGGSWEVRSEPGKGATVEFRLPRA